MALTDLRHTATLLKAGFSLDEVKQIIGIGIKPEPKPEQEPETEPEQEPETDAEPETEPEPEPEPEPEKKQNPLTRREKNTQKPTLIDELSKLL